MTCCIPISRYRYMKRMHANAVKKIEDITKEFDELKETTDEYKEKYEDLMKQMESAKSMGLGGIGGGDEADGGTLLLEAHAYKEEAIKLSAWPTEMKVKDLASMSMEYLHSGVITKDFKGSKTSLRGTLSIKPIEITVVNLSKKTKLQIAASYFKAGRFSSKPDGAIAAGESHTYGISSKDGRAKTGVKGGMAFIVYEVEEPMPNGEAEGAGMEEEKEEEEEEEDVDGGKESTKKKSKEEKKKERQEKKEKKREERKSKKEAKKKLRKGGEKEENEENEEGEEEKKDEKKENGAETEEKAEEGEEAKAEENEGGEQDENKEEEPQSPKEASIHEDHEVDEELPEGNGDFLVCTFENPLAGVPKAKCSKTNSKDIQPVVKQLKNDKPSQQAMFGHYKGGKRHFVFIWKDEDLEW